MIEIEFKRKVNREVQHTSDDAFACAINFFKKIFRYTTQFFLKFYK